MAVGDNNDDIIEHAVVKVGPDLSGFREKLLADLQKAVKGVKPKVTVKLDVDSAGLKKKIQAAVAKAGPVKVKVGVDLDTGHLKAKVDAAAKAAKADTSVKVKVDEQGAVRSIDNVAAAARRARKDTADLMDAFKMDRIIDWGGQGVRPMNALIGAAVALSPALLAVASNAVQASTSIAAMGSAAVGTGLLITGLTVAFSGLTNLLALRKTAQAQAVTEAANSAKTAGANAEAELRNRNALIDAQQAQIKAERELHQARRQAARDLEDLRIKVRDLQNQQKDDQVSLAEAQAKYAAVQRSFFATTLDKARAAQDVANARTRLSDTRLDRKRAKEDLADSVKKGVTKADKVVDAQEQLRAARARVAQARLAKANEGITSSASKATSAEANLQAQLAKASPALREMYHWIDKNQKRFDEWARQIQQAFLPGFNTLLQTITKPNRRGGTSTIQFFIDQMNGLGRIVSKYAGRFGKFTNTPLFREKFASIGANNAKSLENLGHAAETLEKPFLRITEAASPLLVKFTGELDDFAGWLDRVIAKADKSGALATWFDQAGKKLDQWLGIAKNLLSFLGSVMKASMPAGDSLVTQLQELTKSLADWAKSDKGQAQMKAFFDFFKNLDYAQIAHFLTAAGELFLAFRTARWALANPFITALGVFAASNPAAATRLLESMASVVTDVLGFMAAHPAQTAALLTLLSYAKLRKSFGLDLRIPALDGIKSALQSRFKTLDGIFDGSMRTASMTVHAGVVNIVGGAAGKGSKGGGPTVVTPGGGGVGTDEDVKNGAKRTIRERLSGVRLGTWGALIAGTVANYAGQAILDALLSDDPASFQGKLKSSLSAALTGANLGAVFGPAGAAAGAVIGGVADQYLQRQRELKTKQGAEDYAFTLLKQDIGRVTTGGGQLPVNDPKVLQREYVKRYIDARKQNVRASVDAAREKGGEAAADKVLATERQKSIDTLEVLLRQYGYTAKGARDAATDIFGAVKQIGDVPGVAKPASDALGVLKGTLDAVVGDHHIALSVDGYDDTKAKLTEMWNIQRVLYNPTYSNSAGGGGGADTVASQSQYLDPITGQPVPIKRLGRADGGPVPGFSPHPKADNIPALLTAKEYVQPVDAVEHYGVGFMDAVRTKRFPRFADGGRVGSSNVEPGRKWPFNVSTAGIPVPDYSKVQAPVMPGGVASGDVDVARIAEATARRMGATEKQLIALMEAGLVESGMRNLTVAVDHDSLGFLQQRPSQGWGSPAQLTNVAYATRKFIESAMIKDRGAYTAGQLAAAVQRPAKKYRDRYEQRYADALAVLNREAPFLSIGAGAGPMFGPWPDSPGRVHGHDSGIWRRIIAMVPPQLHPHPSGGYNNRRTDNGGWSWHASGRAVDFAGYNQDKLAQFFMARQGAVLELIHRTRTADYGVKRGRIHNMGHEFDLHRDHLHVAMAQGGLVQPRKYDSGGTLPPGYTLAFNGTGRNETVRTDKQEKALTEGRVRLHPADVRLLATHIAAASNQQVAIDGRVVAEANNRNTYLPAGV